MSNNPGVSIKVVIKTLEEFYSAQFFQSDNGEPCVSLKDDNKIKTMTLTSRQWSEWLLRLIRKQGWSASEHRRNEINHHLSSLTNDSLKKTFVRVARTQDSVQIDLNDETYNAVHISKDIKGFEVKQPDNAFFLRPMKQRPLPRPKKVKREDFLADFKKVFSAAGDMWLLVLVFILKCLHRDSGSYIFLVIGGQQGSGKSIFSRRLKALIDPAEPPFFSPPYKTEDILVASFHSFLLVFDNLSGLDHRMADDFCRLSTGGGITKRKLFENHEEMVYKMHRPCVINGIDEPSNRSDFVDRCLNIELSPLSDNDRKAETQLDLEFQDKHPYLLGGVYDLLSECMRVLPTVRNDRLPRMTDFARMGIAVEKVLKLDPDTFLNSYYDNRKEQSENAFFADDMCCAIYEKFFPDTQSRNARLMPPPSVTKLSGTAHNLMKDLFGGVRSGKPNAPRSAKTFSSWLKRVEPLLKGKGIVVERERTSSKRLITIRLTEPRKPAPVDTDLL